jgi:hypothetical protein
VQEHKSMMPECAFHSPLRAGGIVLKEGHDCASLFPRVKAHFGNKRAR